MAKKKSTDYKDIAIRAIKTFIQAFVAVWVVFDSPLSKEAVTAAAAAGVSAAWNFIKETA